MRRNTRPSSDRQRVARPLTELDSSAATIASTDSTDTSSSLLDIEALPGQLDEHLLQIRTLDDELPYGYLPAVKDQRLGDVLGRPAVEKPP